MKAEIAHGIIDRAVPVALTHDLELVAVESRGFETYRPPFLGQYRSYISGPERQLDGYDELLAQCTCDDAAELALCISARFADYIFLMDGSRRSKGIEHSPYEIGYIDECKQLFLIAYSEIEARVDTLYHHQIILLVGAVDTCRAEYCPGYVGMCLKPCLGLDF